MVHYATQSVLLALDPIIASKDYTKKIMEWLQRLSY
jgi:hypothetical protein